MSTATATKSTKTASTKTSKSTSKKSNKIKSGKYWVTWANKNAKNSTSIDKLEADFKKKVKAFKKALEDAGATVTVSTTRRHKDRAYLFHWCWKISQGKLGGTKISKIPARAGINIEWDHGDAKKSKAGAEEMRSGFSLTKYPISKYAPSLTSNHIKGKAIDMTITWTGKIKVANKSGKKIELTYMKNVKNNKKLHAVGKSYGVKKLLNDAPHWSYNGK